MSDSHGSHGHSSHGHDAHGHDAHGHAATHGQDAHGGGHGHDSGPTRTEVPAFEPTPWAAILVGIVVIGGVVALGMTRDWKKAIGDNPKSRLSAPGFPAR